MKAEFPSVSVVILGKFLPDNFLPEKLATGKVISRKIIDSVSYISLIPSQQIQYKFAWGELLVNRGRVQVTTNDAPYIRICDFVRNAIDLNESESRVSAFGINRDSHFDFQTASLRNKFGTRLAPPEMWGTWGRKIRESIEGEDQGTSFQGGALLLQMRLPFGDGKLFGWRDITVSTSHEIVSNAGVLFRTNHHHQMADENTKAEDKIKNLSEDEITSILLNALSEGFDKSLSDAESIFNEVLSI